MRPHWSRPLMMALLLVIISFRTLSLVKAQDIVIKIASHSPLSGGQDVQGFAIRSGTEFAIQQLGGPLRDQGFDIQFVAFDDQGSPEVGVANAREMVADPDIVAVIGHFNSGVAIPSSEIYNRADLVMVSPANTNPMITDRGLPTVNRVVGRDDFMALVSVQVMQSLGLMSVYIVHDTRVYGAGVAKSFQLNAQELGLEVRGFVGTTETENFSSVIEPILAANPQSVYVAGEIQVIGLLVKQLIDAGYKGQILGADGLDTPTYAELAGQAAVGTYYATTSSPAGAFKGAARFIAEYTDAYGHPPLPTAAESYDATGIVLAAIERAVENMNGALPTREMIAQEVRATADYEGLTGVITFDDNGDRELAHYSVLEVMSGDPGRWNENRVVTQLQIPSPLAADKEDE